MLGESFWWWVADLGWAARESVKWKEVIEGNRSYSNSIRVGSSTSIAAWWNCTVLPSPKLFPVN